LLCRPWRSSFAPSPRRAVLYDAPSPRGKKLFVIKRDTPVELVVHLEGWAKVRDSEGSMAWIESKHLAMRHSVVVTAPRAQIRQSADESAAVVFEAEKNVALDYLEGVSGWLGQGSPSRRSVGLRPRRSDLGSVNT
jgi:hypothetical protein